MVVSKNPGGTKRVTSLADALKLNFGMVTTDRRREHTTGIQSLDASCIFDNLDGNGDHEKAAESAAEEHVDPMTGEEEEVTLQQYPSQRLALRTNLSPATPAPRSHPRVNGGSGTPSTAPLTHTDPTTPPSPRHVPVQRSSISPTPTHLQNDEPAEEYTDERARDVITGRLFGGHIVDEDFDSPQLSAMSGSVAALPGDQLGSSQCGDRDPMASSIFSTAQPLDQALGGSLDAANASDDDDEGLQNPEVEHTITLVGNVRGKTVLIIDDMIDRSASWIAAAETVVKRGNAKEVYCIATHGLFGEDSLEEMEYCECIDHIVVTNSFPISPEKINASKKLVVLDLSHLLAESIRRNHYGESISQLFQHYRD